MSTHIAWSRCDLLVDMGRAVSQQSMKTLCGKRVRVEHIAPIEQATCGECCIREIEEQDAQREALKALENAAPTMFPCRRA